MKKLEGYEARPVETEAKIREAIRAKDALDAAKKEWLRAEAELIATLANGGHNPMGTVNFDAEDLSASLVVSQSISKTVDHESVARFIRTAPPSHPAKKVWRQKFEVDARAMERLRQDHPEAHQQACEFFSTKPGKVSVKFKRVEFLREGES